MTTPKVQFNPSTLKGSYDANTSKAQIVQVPQCEECFPSSQRDIISITLSGINNCPDHDVGWANGTFVLTYPATPRQVWETWYGLGNCCWDCEEQDGDRIRWVVMDLYGVYRVRVVSYKHRYDVGFIFALTGSSYHCSVSESDIPNEYTDCDPSSRWGKHGKCSWQGT